MRYASYVSKNDIFYITKRHLPPGGCFFDTDFERSDLIDRCITAIKCLDGKSGE